MRKLLLAGAALACLTIQANAAGVTGIQDMTNLQRTLTVNADGSINIGTGGGGTLGTTYAPAHTTLSSGATTQVLAASATPAGRLVCNQDSSIIIYIGPNTVSSSTGMQILPGGCFDMTHTTAAIYAIAASGSPVAESVQY
jgi:hypothetical protein